MLDGNKEVSKTGIRMRIVTLHFFHAWVTHRRKINSIKRIGNEEGWIWNKTKEVSVAFINFYQNLLTTSKVKGVE
jgi:hypothetical protein